MQNTSDILHVESLQTNLRCTRKLALSRSFLMFVCLISAIKLWQMCYPSNLDKSFWSDFTSLCARRGLCENQNFCCVQKLYARGVDGGSNCTSIQQKHKRDGKFFCTTSFGYYFIFGHGHFTEKREDENENDRKSLNLPPMRERESRRECKDWDE